MRYPHMLYSTNDITFIYDNKLDEHIISGDMFSMLSLINGGIYFIENLPFKELIFNVVISDSQCRSLFGHDFMRLPNYRIYTLSELLKQCTSSMNHESGVDIEINKGLLNKLKTAYKLLGSMYKFAAYKMEFIEKLYIDDEDGYICGELVKPEHKKLQQQVERISITPLNKLASMDPLYATLRSDCSFSLPYDKWVISYHLNSLPPRFHVGQILIHNDTVLTNMHKFLLTSTVNYKNMFAINRQVKRYDEYDVIVEIQLDSNHTAPKEMLQYIFDEHVQISQPSSNITTRTTNDVNIFILICSIVILVVNFIITAKR